MQIDSSVEFSSPVGKITVGKTHIEEDKTGGFCLGISSDLTQYLKSTGVKSVSTFGNLLVMNELNKNSLR